MRGKLTIDGLTADQVRRRLEHSTGDKKLPISMQTYSRKRPMFSLAMRILGSFSGDSFELRVHNGESFIRLVGTIRAEGGRVEIAWATHSDWTGWLGLAGGLTFAIVFAVWSYFEPQEDGGLFATTMVSLMFPSAIAMWYVLKSRQEVELSGFLDRLFRDVESGDNRSPNHRTP